MRIFTVALFFVVDVVVLIVLPPVSVVLANPPDDEDWPSTVILKPVPGTSQPPSSGHEADADPLDCSGTSTPPTLITIAIFVYKVGAKGRTECDNIADQIGVSSTLSGGLGSSTTTLSESNEYEVEVSVSVSCSLGLWPYRIESYHWAEDSLGEYDGYSASGNMVSCLFHSPPPEEVEEPQPEGSRSE